MGTNEPRLMLTNSKELFPFSNFILIFFSPIFPISVKCHIEFSQFHKLFHFSPRGAVQWAYLVPILSEVFILFSAALIIKSGLSSSFSMQNSRLKGFLFREPRFPSLFFSILPFGSSFYVVLLKIGGDSSCPKIKIIPAYSSG